MLLEYVSGDPQNESAGLGEYVKADEAGVSTTCVVLNIIFSFPNANCDD